MARSDPAPGPGPGRWRRRLVFVLRLTSTAVVLLLLFRFVDPAAVLSALEGADLRYLVLVLLLRPPILLVRSWRFWHLARVTAGRVLPVGRVIGWHFVSLNVGAFTPAGLGELSMVYFMRRENVGASETLTAMALDKIITLGMLSFMGLVGATFYLGLDPRWWLAGGGVLAVLLAAMLTVRRSLGWARSLVGERGRRVLDAFHEALGLASSHPGALLVNIAVAFVQSLLFSAQIWICFRMFDAAVDFAGIFWLTGIGRLANLLPVTIGGLGVYEGSMVLLLEQLGPGREVALAAVLLPRALTWTIAGVVVGLALWWRPAVMAAGPEDPA